MGEVTIKFWGRLSDLAGSDITHPLAEPISVEDFRQVLADKYADGDVATFQKSIRAIINDSLVGEEAVIQSGDVIEFLPPVGGG
ncbi:MAG: MoaD/ThiS family protein [Pseudomonadota bacterium]